MCRVCREIYSSGSGQYTLVNMSPLSRVDQCVTLPVFVCERTLELITGEYCHLLTLIDSVIILWSKLMQRQIPPTGELTRMLQF